MGIEVVGVEVAMIRGEAEAIAGRAVTAEEVILDINLGGGIFHFETMDEQTGGNCVGEGFGVMRGDVIGSDVRLLGERGGHRFPYGSKAEQGVRFCTYWH